MADAPKVPEDTMTRLITSAVLLQLTPGVRDEIIAQAIQMYLLAPADRYSPKTGLHKQMDEAITHAVKLLFNDFLSQDPYKTRLQELVSAKLNELFSTTNEDAKKLVDGIVESALRNAGIRK